MKFLQRWILALGGSLALVTPVFSAAPATGPAAVAPPPVLQIGTGDQVRVEVFGNPDLGTTTNVSDEGAIRMPLAGAVVVRGQSPAEAARRIEIALKTGEYLVDPQVTVTVLQSLSQRVSVLGEVGKEGRYAIESNSTVFDLIALAGGITDKGSDVIYILRADSSGVLKRIPVDLRRIVSARDASTAPIQTLQGGDSIIVPKGTFSIDGRITAPGEYRIEGDMMLFQAIARAGGLTPLGSSSRIEIKRLDADGKLLKFKAKKETRIEPGDVITVNERIF
jgi:polysaccharide biosynthesis/export protein